ncbi:MAG: hypothetical protein U9R60_16450 [Bacteroidota bacterium]|nr:hypothetical protein [Bacteroidota bacterium]
MNFFIFISALITLVAIIGHLTMGRKEYLKPVLDSEIDIIPKKIMQNFFQYMSVFLVVSMIILLAGSHELCPMYDYVHNMIRFIGIVYGCFALTSFIIGLTSGIPGGVLKMFQWLFWALIAASAIIGTL